METTLLFVYGTLKRGCCRGHVLKNQKYLGIATTKEGYRLFDLGSFPGIVESAGGAGVTGELFEIDCRLLPTLDAIEGVSFGLYRYGKLQFSKVSTPNGEDVTHLYPEANVYFYNHSTVGREECGPVWEE